MCLHKKLVSTTTIRFGFYYYHLLSRLGGFCEGPPPKKKAPNDAGPPLPSLGVPSTCRFLSFRKSRSAFSDSDFKTFSRSSNGNVSKANADSMISRGSISCGSQLSKPRRGGRGGLLPRLLRVRLHLRHLRSRWRTNAGCFGARHRQEQTVREIRRRLDFLDQFRFHPSVRFRLDRAIASDPFARRDLC